MGRKLRAGWVNGDRGVAILEFAIVVSLLGVLLSGVVDLGLGWRRSVEVSSTLRSGVRVLANLGDDRVADLETLRALNAGIAEIGAANVERVIIYKSQTADGSVPPQCLSVTPSPDQPRGVDGVCNVYSPEQLAALTPARFSGSTTSCQSEDWDRYYCPVDREARQGAPGGADFVGIWIEVEYEYIVGLLPGDGITMTDDVVMRIEPGA